MSFIFAGNWKMNPVSEEDAKNLFNAYKKFAQKFFKNKITFIVCPSSPHLGLFANVKKPKNLFLGAQDVFYEKEGAYTGMISPVAVYGVGADYTIIGHSEKRLMGDTSEIVSKKVKVAIKSGLKVILCIGEQNRDHEGDFWHELRAQIEESLSSIEKKDLGKIIIAYEPVWAVGEKSNGAMNPDELHETVLFIKKVLSQMFWGQTAKKVEILYGGSVFPENAKDLNEQGNVAGFLVGRASLNKKEIEKILDAVY